MSRSPIWAVLFLVLSLGVELRYDSMRTKPKQDTATLYGDHIWKDSVLVHRDKSLHVVKCQGKINLIPSNQAWPTKGRRKG